MGTTFRIVANNGKNVANVIEPTTKELAKKAWKCFISFYWPESYEAIMNQSNEFTWKGILFKFEEC